MNVIVISGNVGRDPELRHTQTGKAVANFSVATSERNDRTQWFRVIVWEKQAELCAQYVHKGDRVTVQGRMSSRKNDDDGREYWDLIADRVEFASRRDSEGNGQSRRQAEPARKAPADISGIPF
tara:strand:- start:309 stop:680 length:372 start_codon:yes stop_codon:yes gene_type:complete